MFTGCVAAGVFGCAVRTGACSVEWGECLLAGGAMPAFFCTDACGETYDAWNLVGGGACGTAKGWARVLACVVCPGPNFVGGGACLGTDGTLSAFIWANLGGPGGRNGRAAVDGAGAGATAPNGFVCGAVPWPCEGTPRSEPTGEFWKDLVGFITPTPAAAPAEPSGQANQSAVSVKGARLKSSDKNPEANVPAPNRKVQPRQPWPRPLQTPCIGYVPD